MQAASIQAWFNNHVTLDGKPYTLDLDQAEAVGDAHKNTLVTARAGSGKTRVIVAKIAYLVAKQGIKLQDIVAFMFNRTAAAEVNARIGGVLVDGQPLYDASSSKSPIRTASTFHKFALDVVKQSGARPEIISEADQQLLIQNAFAAALRITKIKLARREHAEYLQLVTSFIARAGQKFCGNEGAKDLRAAIKTYCEDPQNTAYNRNIHALCLASYLYYQKSLRAPKTDFNQLMTTAAAILQRQNPDYSHYQYILVDEYQDFSYLFYALISALRANCPAAHLFAVGDDWQAINRFAGSDVDYFLSFATYFPEDPANIPLMTNYRSACKIVENANNYMIKHYDPSAARAIPFSKENGKIHRENPSKIRLDVTDLKEDGLGDARYLKLLKRYASETPKDLATFLPIAKLLKQTAKIIKKHRRQSILLLHRHNFTSIPAITLDDFRLALRQFLDDESILTKTDFDATVRCMTMHKSKGLESEVVILLECDYEQVLSAHPHAALFQLFGDSRASEKADQHRLLYVALTRAKKHLYILSSDQKSPC